MLFLLIFLDGVRYLDKLFSSSSTNSIIVGTFSFIYSRGAYSSRSLIFGKSEVVHDIKPPRPPISVDKMTRLISSFLDIS